MTFVVTLAHFCETHGSYIIMCTQPIPALEDSQEYFIHPPLAAEVCSSCQLVIPKKFNSFPSNLYTGSSSSSKNQGYLSTQYPKSSTRFEALRQIITKEFSIEPEYSNSKPHVFGDSKNGYTAAIGFKLIDGSARGAERRYALMVTSTVENEIFEDVKLNAIMSNLESMVKYIKNRNKTINDIRNKNTDNYDTFLRKASERPRTKSLTEILEDDEIFVRLHLWAANLLEHIG